MSGASNVTELAGHRDRVKKAVQAQLDEALDEARQAATHVFFEALGGLLTPKTELHMVVGVTYVHPSPDAGAAGAGRRLHQPLNIAPPQAGGVHDSGDTTTS